MEFTNDYQFREWLGRTALKDLQEKELFPKKYTITYTGDYYCAYDAWIKIDNTKTVFIEIKVRDETYGEYVLEYKKCKSLYYIAKDLFLNDKEATFIYVNFCKNATYIWNINEYVFNVDKIKWIGMKMNKATSDSRSDKINKSVVLLDPKKSKIIDYKINKKKLYDDEENRLKPNIEKKKGLFD